MKPSQIIAHSELCRQAARNIYPQDPDELFNSVWLKIAEREIQDPTFNPTSPKYYFIKAMRNQVLTWHNERVEVVQVDKIKTILPEINYPATPDDNFVRSWLNTTSSDDNLQFLKNILTLAIKCKDNNQAIKLIGCSHRAYYNYKKRAKKQLYDDYNASNISNLSSVDLV